MAALGILVRYRRSTGPERAQVKWLLAALGVGAVVFPVSWSTDLGPADGALVDVLSVLALGLVPIAILIAILRHRLYDIDRIVSRTVSWGIVSGVLGVLFGALVIGLQGALSGVTQGSTLAVAASTLVAFAAFQPLRRRVQEAVDRRFDRTRYDGARTAAAFAARIRDETDLRWLVGDLERTTVLSVQPGATTVWLRRRGTQS
jgi:Kef-type K+ transport system membrane component KefB